MGEKQIEATVGGTYERDPVTGALRRVEPPVDGAPPPAGCTEEPEEKRKPRGRGTVSRPRAPKLASKEE